MATKNRGVVVATADVVIDALENELDQVEPTVLEQNGLVDRIGERRAQALDMTWMRQYRMWREWIGEREMRSDRRFFQARMYTRKFEDTIRIPIDDIEDGVEANFDPQNEARALREGYETLIDHEHHSYFTNAFNDKFVNGSVTGPYGEEIYVGSLDGEPLLSDSHPYYEQIYFDENAPQGERLNLEKGGEYSNLVNYDLTRSNLYDAIKIFRKFKHHTGRPANMGQPDTLIVGPELQQKAEEILEREIIEENGAGVTNTVPDLQLVVNNWLTGSVENTDFNFGGTGYTGKDINLDQMWFLVNTRPDRSPFVHWDRKTPEVQRPVGTPDLSSESPAEGSVDYLTFKDDAAFVGARARFGVSFGVPQVMLGSFGGVTL